MEEREYEVMAAVEDRHFWFVGMRAIVRDVFVTAGFGPDSKVLDIGCGTGGTMRSLRGLAGFVGLDVSLTAARLARRRTGNPTVVGSAIAPPFEDGSFDCVLALDVFEHVEDHLTAAKEVRRILKPGGALVATVPCHPSLFSEHDEALHHVRRYTRKGFLGLLHEGGFRVERSTWVNSILFPAAATFRLTAGRMRRGKGKPSSDASMKVGAINGLLTKVFMVERAMLSRFDMPFGLGLMAVARK